jgi:DNA processing protein
MQISTMRDWIAFSRLPGIGLQNKHQLLERFNDPSELLSLPVDSWGISGETTPLLELLKGWPDTGNDNPLARFVNRQLDCLRVHGDQLICLHDPRYPSALREIPAAPLVLYVRGDVALLRSDQLAIVGSRKASAAGRRTAQEVAAGAALVGLTVTSGMAIGIDGAAHEGALAAGGLSVAVVATGLDVCYPARHADLANRLERHGTLVSENPYGSKPNRAAFPRRNRIISGLSKGVLVVEAALPSGSLITANLAAEHGRDVFAVPGSIYQQGSRGCHQLIRDGACLVESFVDIVNEWGMQQLPLPGTEQEDALAGLEQAHRRLLNAVGYQPCTLDDLVAELSSPVGEVLAQLADLELAGLVEQQSGGYQRT